MTYCTTRWLGALNPKPQTLNPSHFHSQVVRGSDLLQLMQARAQITHLPSSASSAPPAPSAFASGGIAAEPSSCLSFTAGGGIAAEPSSCLSFTAVGAASLDLSWADSTLDVTGGGGVSVGDVSVASAAGGVRERKARRLDASFRVLCGV